MIAGEDDYWTHPDGTRYEVGDQIPVLRINNLVLFNEHIVKGTCDMCDWACIAPTVLLYQASEAHVATHIMNELMDEERKSDSVFGRNFDPKKFE